MKRRSKISNLFIVSKYGKSVLELYNCDVHQCTLEGFRRVEPEGVVVAPLGFRMKIKAVFKLIRFLFV